jgi:hypothetical protein
LKFSFVLSISLRDLAAPLTVELKYLQLTLRRSVHCLLRSFSDDLYQKLDLPEVSVFAHYAARTTFHAMTSHSDDLGAEATLLLTFGDRDRMMEGADRYFPVVWR